MFTMIIDTLTDATKFQEIADILLALEGLVIGLIGIFGGADALKRYREGKFQRSLRLAIETAVGYVSAINQGPGALGEIIPDLTPDLEQKALAYVKTSVPEAVKALTKKLTDEERDTVLLKMITAQQLLLGTKAKE